MSFRRSPFGESPLGETPRLGKRLLDDLEAFEGRKFYSLSQTKELLAALGNPQDKTRSIHIVGTNGKGSVGAMLASILAAGGKTTGQTCSPHLYSVTERCFINGRPQFARDYYAAVERAYSMSRRLAGEPTYFVLSLVASFLEFARLQLDWSVIEAGLGGDDDATNCLLHPSANVVTSIGFDHVEILGGTLREIAQRKAGIAKAGVPMFAGEVSDEAAESIRDCCTRAGSSIEISGRDFHLNADRGVLITNGYEYPLNLGVLALSGGFQRRNAVLAARTAYALGCDAESVHRGLASVRWPGRCEEIEIGLQTDTKKVLLDVAHNPEGARSIADELAERTPEPDSLTFVVSTLDRKDYRSLLGELVVLGNKRAASGFTDYWICTSSEHPHVRPPEELAAYLRETGMENVSVERSPDKALDSAKRLAGPSSLIVITGSLFLVGRLRPALTSIPVLTYVRHSDS